MRAGALARTVLLRQSHIPRVGDFPKARPVITRTRSWRGLMQVRFNDTRADHGFLIRQAFLWSPLRVFGSGFVLALFLYFYLGHDQFMYQMFGFESEAMVEFRVIGRPAKSVGELLQNDRGFFSPVRHLEVDLHPKPEFDAWKDKERRGANADTPEEPEKMDELIPQSKY
jgi:hypothetical protein